MNNITFAQTIFSVTGLVFVAFSLIFIILLRKARFGILTLLLANVFFWSAIVFPKVVISILYLVKLPDLFPTMEPKILGAISGVVVFIIWFVFAMLVAKPFKKKPTPKEDEKESIDDNNKENDKEMIQENSSVSDEKVNEVKSEEKVTE